MTSTKVGTGDIILSNWVTPLGQIARKSGQRWSHVAIILTLDDEVRVAEISFEQKVITIIPFSDYIGKDPRLEEIGIRRLKQELSSQSEDKIMDNIATMMEEVHYPDFGQMLGRLIGLNHHHNVSICSEFVIEVLKRTKIINGPGIGHHFDGYTKTDGKEHIHHYPVVLPDHLLPSKDGGTTILDAVYNDKLEVYTMRSHSPEERKEILKPQLGSLIQLLL